MKREREGQQQRAGDSGPELGLVSHVNAAGVLFAVRQSGDTTPCGMTGVT